MNRRFSIVIPSKRIRNLIPCIRQLRAMGETARVIVVDDGLTVPLSMPSAELAPLLETDVEVIKGADLFVFARNVNLGIEAAGTDDVLVLNDDVLLETFRGFSALQTQQNAHPEYGAIGPSFDCSGQLAVMRQMRLREFGEKLYEEKATLIFACVFIPRSVLDKVGLLDERFGINAGGPRSRGYGCEDDDYSLRIRQAGWKLGAFDGVLVDHGSLPSTFRHDPQHPIDQFAHEQVFRQKHGRSPRQI